MSSVPITTETKNSDGSGPLFIKLERRDSNDYNLAEGLEGGFAKEKFSHFTQIKNYKGGVK